MAEGIDVRHQATCRSREGGRCNCSPTYRVRIKDKRLTKRVDRSFRSYAEARSYRADVIAGLESRTLQPSSPRTVREAAHEFLAGMESGIVRDRSGRAYKPGSARDYRQSLEAYVLPALGDCPLSDLRRREVQALADELLGSGLDPSTVRNKLDPLRAMCRHALRRDLLTINPTADLELPASRRKRVRIVTPAEAQALIDALPTGERALWATAFYAGLRRGELQALRVLDVDLGKSLIRVERGWDPVEGPIDPKSEKGRRTVPLLAILRDYLDEHLLATGRTGDELVFGRTAGHAFVPSTVRNRANKAWDRAGLERIGLHRCRHTYASLLIEVGTNPKAVQEFMGHASMTMTTDTYGHLMPGNRDEARARTDAYLEAQLGPRGPLVDHTTGAQATPGDPIRP